MSKSTKPKVAVTKKSEEVKPELPKVETIETITGDIDTLVSESKLPEPVIGDTPPSTTLDEVEQVKEEPETILVSENINDSIKRMEAEQELSKEQRIINYLEDKPKGDIRVNDFLKSLFGVSKLNEPPMWQNQAASKEIKGLLDKMQAAGYLEVVNNAHLKLGQTYYPDTTTMRAVQYDLNSAPIFIKKVN